MNRSQRVEIKGYLMVFPAFIIVFLILFLPTLNTIRLSFTHFSLLRQVESGSFVGLSHYRELLKNDEFLHSMFNTFKFAGVSVFFEVIFGVFLALSVNRAFAFRGIMRTAILFPWILPTALNAIVWRWLFNTDFGVFNILLHFMGFSEKINWLGEIPLAMNSMIFVAIWKTSSFIALIVLTGLQSIPGELYQAASIDGASKRQMFSRITLPLLIPSILLAVLFRSMDAFRSFELPFALTQGGPAGSTQTLSLFGYRQFFQFLKFDTGAAVSFIQFLIILILGLIYIKTLKTGSDL